jgi:transglutaminase-like putative cysteine protease
MPARNHNQGKTLRHDLHTTGPLRDLAAILALAPLVAFAQPATDATLLQSQTHYELQSDGRFTVDERNVLRINTPKGVQMFGQIPQHYSASLQKLEVVAAWVEGKEGQRSDVPADRILEQQSPQSAGAPMFSDGRVKTIVFPGVEPGSVLHVHTRRSQVKPMFEGQFSMVEMPPPIVDVKAATITLQAPAAMKLYVDAQQFSGGAVAAPAAGLQAWRWEVKDLAAMPMEAGASAAQDQGPRLAVTTFASDQAAATAYAARALPMAEVTPALQVLADDITQGHTEPRAMADAMYRWVAANVRYVAIFMDVGGVVPHSADEIAKARYGDCKDHTTVLAALLKAKGIASSPVLVNADLRYWKPAVAVTPGVFNHAILHVTSLGVPLDSTAGLASFGALPIPLRGEPRDLTCPHRYTSQFTLPGYVQLPGPGAFVVPAGFGSFASIAATFELLGPAERQLPMPLLGKRVEEVTTLQWPAGFKPTAVPRDAQIDWTHGRYTVKVLAEATQLTITRVLELTPPGPQLRPQDYPAFRQFGQAVMRDLRAQVVY